MTKSSRAGERLFSWVTVNLGTKIISIIIAVVLWIVVLGSRNVEVTKEIPLEVITSSDIVSANDIPDKIAFRMSGPKAFLRAILDRREEPIRVNLSGAKPGLVTYRFFSDNIRVPIGVKVLAINPTAILIKLEAVKHREVPVKLELKGAAPDGYRVSKTYLKPETVKIKGAESRVDGITDVHSIPLDISGVRQSGEKEIAVDAARYNVELDGPLPKAYIELEPVAANFRIKNVDVRVNSSFKSKLDEKAVTVLVHADAADLKALDRSRIYAIVDLTGKPKGKYKEEVHVTLPDDVRLVKVVPDHVGVTLY
jgi:YbbR domain-containing protein